MKQFIASAILMAVGAAYASTPALYECIYSYDMKGNSNGKDFSEKTNCILLIGEEHSKFYDYPTFRLDSVSALPGVSDDTVKDYHTQVLKSASFFEQEINTSLKDNNILVFCDMAPERYKYEQKLPLIDWEETDETSTICGYQCRKAVGEYGGRKWNAWYSEEIAVPFGPWKILGLPGLILKAIDDSGTHSFEVITFRKGNGEFAPSKLPNQISIQHDKFIELKNEYDQDPSVAINPESISSISVFDENIIINGIKSRVNKNKSVPLEYSQAELSGKKKDKSSKEKNKRTGYDEIKVIDVGSVPR